MYTWPCFLNYLLAAAPLMEAESVLHVPSHDSCKAILQVGVWFFFPQLFFNALLVCPLISPPVWVCLGAQKKYNLTCDNFVRGANDIFSKAKFVDKGWICSSWNVYVVCLRRVSAWLCWQEDNYTFALVSGLYNYMRLYTNVCTFFKNCKTECRTISARQTAWLNVQTVLMPVSVNLHQTSNFTEFEVVFLLKVHCVWFWVKCNRVFIIMVYLVSDLL